jgi:GNAT superfamily N-acetyltransferase
MMMGGHDGFEIRTASVDDAGTLAELGARLFEQAFGAMNTPEDMRDYVASAFSTDIQTTELADSGRATFLAVDPAGEPIGYAMVRRNRTSDGVAGVAPVELQRIYVDLPWHGRGVGDALMSRCVEQARAWGCDAFWLGVWQKNPRAIAFYQRSGFTTVGVATFRVGRDVQHDFVMARPLS